MITLYTGKSWTYRPMLRRARFSPISWFVEIHLFGVHVGLAR